MRISDWSSDVCSSDLLQFCVAPPFFIGAGLDAQRGQRVQVGRVDAQWPVHQLTIARPFLRLEAPVACYLVVRGSGDQRTLLVLRIAGRGGDRTSGVWGKSVAVRVDLGGSRIVK